MGLNFNGSDRTKKTAPKEDAAATRMFLAACKAHGLPEPVAEYQFHPERKWKFDWLFEGLVAVEKEGGIYGKGKPCVMCKRRPPGAHSSIERLKSDMEKYNEAAMAGFLLIRVLPEQIEDGSAFALIKRALEMAEIP
jgi:hypothetical protein